ncbi:MAG: DsbA family protein [Wolbachia endosymbiont of Tyrophagus putrescentiae]|nr:DsbA family protein [Wolbachia endosymbiont of Tyrophagus putrescentiae]
MSRVPFLLILIVVIASLPVINNWLSTQKKPAEVELSDSYIGKRLDDYISRNIDQILATIQAKSNEAARDNVVKNRILQYKDRIFNENYPYSGNKDSNVIAVGFFDYSCGYCKLIKDDIKQLINDGKIKYIFRDTPILGKGSMKAAKSALAVYFLDEKKYLGFHDAALSHKGEFSDDVILNIVESLGINKDDFSASLDNNMDKIKHMINDSRLLVNDLGVGGTPFLIIGDSIFVGATDLSVLRRKVDELKNK